MSDKDQLIAMGFDEKRVLKAMKKTNGAGLQPAMDWLLANPDDDGSEDQIAIEENDDPILESEATANSLKCEDCGRLLRDANAAEFHAVKTGHANFSESHEIIKPLTAEEKALKVQQLKEKIAERKKQREIEEIMENKQKEKVKRTSAAEMNLIREKLAADEMAKQVAERKRLKEEDRIAKENIRRQLEADKLERKRLEEERKGAPPQQVKVESPTIPKKDYNETRIQIRTPTGPLTNVFKADDKLSSVFDFCKSKYSGEFKLSMTFPRKVFGESEMSMTLAQLQLVPSAALLLQ